MSTWLEELPLEECVMLLAGSALGRLGVVVDGTPEIFPVNHTVDPVTGCIVFPTNHRTKFQAALHWPTVAFEVDGLEPDGRSGWSVMVIGHAEEVTDLGEQVRAAAHRFVLWGTGPHTVWLRIVPERITGRRISAVPTAAMPAT
jgi:nitroimidazol reductase NimA-like FMN-containing flavoprotein (pyridoxamine 5'-phosphate oxidase superfamily)